ncbi:MAG TPA: hypothetical protein VGO83_01995 [Thermoleophilaceae bacterium]|nr:hypothetical protein [Thermoleophilaceae bacterium]
MKDLLAPLSTRPTAVRTGAAALACAIALAAVATATVATAQAAPVSAHAMVHTCCTPQAEKERIFAEAKALGAAYVRADVELDGIYVGRGSDPDWGRLDDVIALSRKYRLPVLAILVVPNWYADAEEFGLRAGEIAAHAGAAIDHWEILNEPDGDWAFHGSAEDYARILSAAHDAIKARVPGAQVVMGGLLEPNRTAWLERVFATPGADALHKFDIANVHLRGNVDAVVHRYREFGSWLASRGFHGPLWVTEHGYPADPVFQIDRDFAGGERTQGAYLTQSLVGLGEAGVDQVFVTLHDGGLQGPYATEGLERIGGPPDFAVTRRPAFAAVRRVVDDWDELLAWRREQRENELAMEADLAASAASAAEAEAARGPYREARRAVRGLGRSRPDSRIAQARALLAGRHTALLWHTAVARWQRDRAAERGRVVAALERRIAGPGG